MRYLLGIDGGGSTCRTELADSGGRVLGAGCAGPANIITDAEAARRNILAATQEALAAAGQPCAMSDLVAVLGLAGVNIADRPEAFGQSLPFARVRVVSDALIALHGALGGADGAMALLGTGSVFGSLRGGQVQMLGGWGLGLRDEASGAWLGRGLLQLALRADDGLAEMTPLLRAVLDEHGGGQRAAPAIARFAASAGPADYARLAPRVTGSDDPAAQTLLARADTHVVAALERLCDGADLPVCFTGGLAPVYAERLAPRYGARIRPALGSPLAGALALAREVQP